MNQYLQSVKILFFFKEKNVCVILAEICFCAGGIDPNCILFCCTGALFIFDIRPIASAAIPSAISNTNKRVNIKCLGINRILTGRIACFARRVQIAAAAAIIAGETKITLVGRAGRSIRSTIRENYADPISHRSS